MVKPGLYSASAWPICVRENGNAEACPLHIRFVFTVVAVAHVVRLSTGIEIVVDGVILPMWVSLLGALIAAPLAVWMVVAARRS